MSGHDNHVHVRMVDQLSGEIARRPSKFFAALSEADAFCADRDLAKMDADDAAETIRLLIAERDSLQDELLDDRESAGELRARLDEALAEIAELRADLASTLNERDIYRSLAQAR